MKFCDDSRQLSEKQNHMKVDGESPNSECTVACAKGVVGDPTRQNRDQMHDFKNFGSSTTAAMIIHRSREWTSLSPDCCSRRTAEHGF